MSLPEIREADASPDVAARYAELREGLGVPLVNLIWRHLPTLGVLDWAVEAVRPVLASGALYGARERLMAALPLPPLPPVTAGAWQAAGLDDTTLEAVRDVAATYNRGNCSNVIMLTALRRALEDAPPGDTPPPATAPRGAMLPAVPALPKLDALPPAVADEIRALAAGHDAAAQGIIPSLYLHLALWPALLQPLRGWLAPMLQTETLRAARQAAVVQATREADALRPQLALGDGLPPAQRAAAVAVLTTFTTSVIPDMAPVGLALARVLPQ